MVWFHGGGFMCGAGIQAYYGPDFLLEHEIILVGANYRVGKFVLPVSKLELDLMLVQLKMQ